MSHIFGRQTKGKMPVAARGEGIFLYDETGKRYLDASGGAAVSCLGHCHPEVRAAMKSQLDKLEYVHTGSFSHEAEQELADILAAHAPEGLSRVVFSSGGSMMIEAGLKLARQYHVERGQDQRRHFISRNFSFHGSTLGALATSGYTSRRRNFEPLMIEVRKISPCFAYRGKRFGESDEAYGLRVANELEAAILELGANSVIAFVAETVVGSTIGAVPPVPDYFKRIREICDRYGVLLILDEVMCGMGRTGTRHACEQEGIVPDILVMAKGLSGGYEPVGAMLVSTQIFDTIREGSGRFNHGHTYMAHPMGCAAAVAVQKVIERDHLLENVRRQGAVLERALVERFGAHPHVGDIRGRGLFWAIELVADRKTKTPFPAQCNLNLRVKSKAMSLGLVCYPGGGTADGIAGDHVLIAPPFIIAEQDIAQIVELLGLAVDNALAEIR